jgi:integrase
MESHFYLQNKGAKEHQIYHFIYCGFKKPIKYYVGKRINPKYWNKERAKGNSFAALNFYLDSLEAKANNIYLDLKLNGNLSPDVFLVRLKGTQLNKTVLEYFEDFLEESKSRLSKTSGKVLTQKSLNQYRSCKNLLVEFAKTYELTFEKIDMKFYGKLRTHVLATSNANTFGSKVKVLKTFLTWATYQNLPVNPIYKKFERHQKYADAEPLTWDELEKLWKLDLKLNPELRKPLDIFLFLCSSGLRISDYNTLRKENFKTDHIELSQTKTSGKAIIPLHDDKYFKAGYLIKKYKGELPTMSGQKLNPYLTSIASMAKIKRIKVSSKTGRKTFATLKLLLGISPYTVMRMGGWKSYSSFRAYVGIGVEDVIKENKEKSILSL